MRVGRYRRDEQIGFGNFGVVYKGLDTVTNRVVAIKSLDLDSVSEEVETVQHEVSLLAQLSSAESSNVTKYYGTVLQGSKLWIIMDLCYGGSVRTLLRPGPIEEKLLSVLFREITVAVRAIHSLGIIHRDIKAANVLVTMGGQVKLCDFGVAAVNPNNVQTKRQTIVGTPYWMAPEVIQEGQSYTNKADLWSLGITFYEIVTGNPPYSDQEAMRAMMLITSSRPPRLEGPKFSPSLKDLVALCLDEVPEARPEASELLKHKFIKNYAKTSVTVLRALVDRYSAWKERHSDQRDSLLMFNPHKKEETEEVDDESWDFSMDSEAGSGDEIETDLSNAPDSLKELFPGAKVVSKPAESPHAPFISIPVPSSPLQTPALPPLHKHIAPAPDLPAPNFATPNFATSNVQQSSPQPPSVPHIPQVQPKVQPQIQPTSTHAGLPRLEEKPEFEHVKERVPPQLTRLPTAISVNRARSTTVASPSGSWAGWRARHGSEAQLDTLKLRPDHSKDAESQSPEPLLESGQVSPTDGATITPQLSPSPKRSVPAKPRASLPRLQMPSRPVAKAPRAKNNEWPQEFPEMPQVDCNVWLDSTPKQLAADHLLNLLVQYKAAVSSLAGQIN